MAVTSESPQFGIFLTLTFALPVHAQVGREAQTGKMFIEMMQGKRFVGILVEKLVLDIVLRINFSEPCLFAANLMILPTRANKILKCAAITVICLKHK